MGISALIALATTIVAAPAQAEPITLAIASPLSEPGDVRSGEAIRKSAELWIDHINQQGGIIGREVELGKFDTKGKPEVGAAVVERAITERNASAILGVWSSSVVLAMMDVVHRYNVPMLCFYSWSDDITKKNYPQVFRTGPYNSQIAGDVAPYVKHKGYDKVTVLAEDTDYGIGWADAFVKAMKGTGLEVNVVQFQAQAQDLTPQLVRIRAQRPDAIIVQAVYAASNLSIKQAREVGYQGDIITGWDWPVLPDFWPTVGKAGVGVVYPTFYDPSLSLTAEGERFRKLYTERYGSDPAIFQYFLWDNFNAVKAAIEKARSAKPAALVETLPAVSFEGTTGQIGFQRKEGTVHFNQWEGFSMFFKEMTAQGQTGAEAKPVYSVK
ncbi:MAG: ABC transporter substrate-binding protein [Gammaproteobacteria bacterium]|nr:ABC transporter substrate-binding protein [Gammaproteobacteria bacterium]NIR82932.1 ABC transporter substrate-binding protein [Gammaproteobacteria bacterium]NIR90201.1 ABC transporter substrate-binding protein [Gammaproteobacteria bacterium]NIU04078.1 ABC transporter substrate-binding protein [Gammaproteobacteria bacterium]NIV51067.1 ABC transporter substrate-binding protein [Gammaproteobacteria bacterium]